MKIHYFSSSKLNQFECAREKRDYVTFYSFFFQIPFFIEISILVFRKNKKAEKCWGVKSGECVP